MTRVLLYGALVVAFIVRNDFWWWDDRRSLIGLPIGLTYHVLFCLAVALVMGLLVRYAWPADLESEQQP